MRHRRESWYNIRMKRHLIVCWLLLPIAGFAVRAEEAEPHAEAIVRRVLAEVAKVRARDPLAVPMAFWDLDGTIIRGDSGFGLVEDGRVLYRGLIEGLILDGVNAIYGGEADYRRWQRDYQYMMSIGPWLSQSFNAQMYAGVEEARLDAACRAVIERQRLPDWYFSSSMAIWKALAGAGVENCVVSANAEALIRNLAPTLGIPRERIRGVRVVSEGGRWTTKIRHPVPHGEGKTEAMLAMVQARPHGVAVAAFGNSYETDGLFLRHVATQTALPGGARGTAVMINGGPARPGFSEHFVCVGQTNVIARVVR